MLWTAPYMGATPDNIFTCSCCADACVEYKCPYSIRTEEIANSWKKTTFLEFNEIELRLKRSHTYYSQVQGQMAITGNKRTYFVVWTEKGDPFIESIGFDKEYWEKVQNSIMVFLRHIFKVYCLDLKTFTLALYVQNLD